MIVSHQPLSARKNKELKRLPEPVKKTIQAYQQRGFWFEEIIANRKTYWIVQLSQYHFPDRASEQCWYHQSIYKIRSNGEPQLARSRSKSPTGVIINRTFIKL